MKKLEYFRVYRKFMNDAKNFSKNIINNLVNYHDRSGFFEQLEPRLLLSGTTYVVDTLNDVVDNDGYLSFREVILASNSNDSVNEAPAGTENFQYIITISENLYCSGHVDLQLINGSIEIADDISIHGKSVDEITINGNWQIYIDSGVTTGFSNITLQNELLIQGNLALKNITINHSILLDSGTLTLDNVTLNADLAANGSVHVTNGLELNGVVTQGYGQSLIFSGTQTLSGSGQVVLAGDQSCISVECQYDTPAILTVGSGITLMMNGLWTTISGYNGSMVSQGRIVANEFESGPIIEVSNLYNEGSIAVNKGSTLTVRGIFTNQASGSVSITGGGELRLDGVLQNNGAITAESSVLIGGGPDVGWSNNGTISATNSTVYYGGSFKLSDVGIFNRDNTTVLLSGTLDNTGDVLFVDNAFAGDFELFGGTIFGGSLDSVDSSYIFVANGGIIDGVSLNMSMRVMDRVIIANNLELNGEIRVDDDSYLVFSGSQVPKGDRKVALFGFRSGLVVDRDLITLIRELKRKLSSEALEVHQQSLDLYDRVQHQQRSDSNKIYSLHEPGVSCIGKGKAHKKYELGAKASVTVTKTSGIIVGALSFHDNPFDGHTLPAVLTQVESIVGKRPTMAICDRGYRGKRKIGTTRIEIPESGKGPKTKHEKRQARERFRRRTAIEPIIGHFKNDHRMLRNYLKGRIGDSVNLFMACAAFNFRKFIRIRYFLCLKLFGHIFRPNVRHVQACA